MKITVITINRNNAAGLEKTMQSVFSQICPGFEYVVVDGASTDNSVRVIERYADMFGDRMKWISEPDGGIYNAMNKGIGMSSGTYLQFLNSGDCLVSEDVLSNLSSILRGNEQASILYGNLLKAMPNGKVIHDKSFSGKEMTFLDFYNGTLNHSSAFIRRDLFSKYGLYDESLKIVSDWKWFLQAIVFGGEKPIYADVDITLFDMTGISETNTGLTQSERKKVLNESVCPAILSDYREWSQAIRQMKRIQRHPWASKLIRFMDRVIFKLEKI